ncbi:MAG: hypothetical protein ACOYMA_00565 [Bacteroidia bacterium]
MPCGPILYYDQGQLATIVLHTNKNSENPIIQKIIAPNMNALQGFPAPMHKLDKDDNEIFVARFKLPTGSSNCGTYLCFIKWEEISGDNKIECKDVYTVIVRQQSSSISVSGI